MCVDESDAVYASGSIQPGRKQQMSQRFHGTVGERLGALSADQGGHFAVAYRHGTMSVELAAPRHPDTQQPHAQDEIYFVVSGSGWFLNGDVRHRFDAGDVLFVPAGVVHRFEEHSEDTLVWVVFYGREGGEGSGISGHRSTKSGSMIGR
jgi:mannose-6-phosphate isomerase-like protein (cupin superfamily)